MPPPAVLPPPPTLPHGARRTAHNATHPRYSNRTARGTAVGDEPQSIYAVLGGRHFNGGCCFDYGNAENITADGSAGPMYDGSMVSCSDVVVVALWGGGANKKTKGRGVQP